MRNTKNSFGRHAPSKESGRGALPQIPNGRAILAIALSVAAGVGVVAASGTDGHDGDGDGIGTGDGNGDDMTEATEIDECTTIDEPGHYVLTEDIEDTTGITVTDSETVAMIANTANDNADDGIEVTDSNGVLVLLNELEGNGDQAIEINDSENVIRLNSVEDAEALLSEVFG